MRKLLFWAHLCAGITAGLFIFIMAATGVLLSFEKQMTDFVDRDLRTIAVPNEAQLRPLNELLEVVRRSGQGEPSSIVLRDDPQSAAQFSIGRGKTIYVDPYSGAVLGVSSPAAHQFFSVVERLHRTLGEPLGSKSIGHWLTAVSNLLFGVLILLGVFLWLPRKWNWTAFRGVLVLRGRLRGKARDWNWHNVIGIWCAAPLLVIVLTGVVMSFDWANALLFRLTGSQPTAAARGGRDRGSRDRGDAAMGHEPNYNRLFTAAMTLNPDWRTISLAVGAQCRGTDFCFNRYRHGRAAAETHSVSLEPGKWRSDQSDSLHGRQSGPKITCVCPVRTYGRIRRIGGSSNRRALFARGLRTGVYRLRACHTKA